MSEMVRITKDDVAGAREERDGLFSRGQKLQHDWVEFHLAVLAFKKAVVKGSFKWELCGYKNWTAFVGALCKRIGESRSAFLEKLKTVEALPPAKIRELGKSKAFVAKRLMRAGKWNEKTEEVIKKATADGARKIAKRLARPEEETRTALTWLLLDSQYGLVVYQVERIKRVLGLNTMESVVDFVFGDIIGSRSDDELWRLHTSGSAEPVAPAEMRQ